MNRDQRRILRKAANLLLAEAKVSRESCAGSNGALWVCGDCGAGKCRAERHHDALLKSASQLKAMAR